MYIVYNIHIFRSILKPNNLKVVPVGLNRGVKKIVSSRIPNLGRLEDLADIVTGAGNISESEAEVDNHFGIVIGKGEGRLFPPSRNGGGEPCYRLLQELV